MFQAQVDGCLGPAATRFSIDSKQCHFLIDRLDNWRVQWTILSNPGRLCGLLARSLSSLASDLIQLYRRTIHDLSTPIEYQFPIRTNCIPQSHYFTAAPIAPRCSLIVRWYPTLGYFLVGHLILLG